MLLWVKRFPAEHMNWLWISNYYDIPLDGLCIVNKVVCIFKIRDSHRANIRYEVFIPSGWERTTWLLRKKLFEICVGEHWTYPHRAEGVRYKHGRTVTKLYYKFKLNKLFK
jgi:hypothetical protein